MKNIELVSMRLSAIFVMMSILCQTSFVVAQNFAPVGAKWYMVFTHENVGPTMYFPRYTLEVQSDTLVGGHVAGALKYGPNNFGWPSDPITYLYEENGRVYFYEDETYKLLYDFNLNPGDTLFFRVPRAWWLYENGSPGNDSIRMVLIDSVDWVEKDGLILRRLHTSLDPNQWWQCIELGKVVERVGAETGLFGRSCIIHAGDAPEHVRCYEDSLIQYTVGLYACDYVNDKPFAPPRAIWHFETYSADCIARSYFRLESDFYSSQVDIGVRRVRKYHEDDNTPLAEVILRHDFDEVRFYEDGEFKLLYDFSLEAGDTMTFYLPRIRHHFDFTCNDSLPLSLPYHVFIDSVTIETIDGLELKSLHTSPLGSDCVDLGVVTEKFGSSNGLFGMHCNVCTVGCSGHFRCYSDDDISYMASSEDCDYTTATISVDPIPDIYIYPNPTTNLVFLNGIQSSDISSLTLIDGMGRQYELPVSVTIDVSGIAMGCYFLSIVLRNGSNVMSRMIKTRN